MTKVKERKKIIDELAAKIFDYIEEACADKEGHDRMMELSMSFLTATIDIEKPLDEISAELRNKTAFCYMAAMDQIIQVKKGSNKNIISEHR